MVVFACFMNISGWLCMKVVLVFHLHVKTGASVLNGTKAGTSRASVLEDLLVHDVKVCYDNDMVLIW